MFGSSEFQEIGHSGGKMFIKAATVDGARRFDLQWTHSRPVPTILTGVWAHRDGVPVATLPLGGIGYSPDPPPFRDCYQVLLASDTQGEFGHECDACQGYWRSGPFPQFCPYCRRSGDQISFLTEAQRRYIKQYCDRMTEVLTCECDGEYMIDMDAVADAVGREGKKPDFYYAEKAQQNKFRCSACNEFNDILGKFVYCSGCGTRNDVDEIEKTIKRIRDQINSVGLYETCAKESVSAFDALVKAHAQQLIKLIPMTLRRVIHILKGRVFTI